MSYGRALSLQAEREPERIALVCNRETWTRAELDRASNRLARDFAARGVALGDFVTIGLPNSGEFLIAAFAAWKLGAVPQPISSRLPLAERNAVLERAKPALIVGAEPGSFGATPCLPLGHAPPPELDAGALPDRIAPHRQALASGGSTGTPKLIVDALAATCDPSEPFYGNQPGTPVLTPGPLYHAGPFINSVVTLLGGGRLVLMHRFDPEEALALIEEHRVEWVNFVPTMMHRIWRLPEAVRNRYDLSSLRVVMSSGAAIPDWLFRAWIEWLGPDRVQQAYGGTERIGGTHITGRDWLLRPGSVGKPTGGRLIRVQDEHGKPLPAGEIGEVFMLPPGGKGSTYRYVGAEARASSDGWETLGDMGYLDADGFLFLVDRRTDMVVTGGANVYPAEVEAAIDAHPQVGSSAVIGLPDDDLGQRLHAIVQIAGELSGDDLVKHLEARIARHKIPRSFEFTREPLRDDAGKVRRPALRAARLPQN
jgi:bile acid-coenzyme A ligase